MTERELHDIIRKNVISQRQKRGLSQLKLANMLGHQSTSYVARIELGTHEVHFNLGHLLKIADEFEMDLRDLIPSTFST